MAEFVRNYLKTGVRESNEPDKNQQIIVANLFGFIGYSLTFLLGCSALLRGDSLLMTVLFVSSVLFFSSHLILKFSSSSNSYRFSANLVTISLIILMLYLVYSGGHSNTGPLWIYIVPPVILFFGGMLKGLRNLALFVLVVSLLLFYPDERLLLASYTYEFKSRLIYSFLTVSALFTFYEYSRQRLYKHMLQISQKFEQQARHDPLSGLQNRRGMIEKLNYEHERANRNRHHMSLMMCDIDHFKLINDKHGHEAGDSIIKELADMFTASLRKQDTVARWGGEEFLFLLPETSAEHAYVLAENIRNMTTTRTFTYQQEKIDFTLSFGLYEVQNSDSVESAISKADINLYKAKGYGRNQTVVNK